MKRIYITLIALTASWCTIAAQESNDTVVVDRQINIEKEYTPEIKEVKRKDIEYQIEEVQTKEADLVYSNYVLPLIPRTPFTPLEPEKQSIVRMRTPKDGYAELGLGFDLNWRAQAYYKILKSETDKMDVQLRHYGTYWGEGASKSNPKTNIFTNVGLNYAHCIDKKHELGAKVSYGNRYYSYYGTDSLQWNDLDTICRFQSRHTMNAEFNARSLKSNKDWDYETKAGYLLNNLQYCNTTEHEIYVSGQGRRTFGKHQIEITLKGEGWIYSKNAKGYNNAVIELEPAYNLNHKQVDVHAGVRMAVSAIQDEGFYAMPNITAAYHAHKMVRLDFAATGDVRTNQLSQIMDINPYFNVFTAKVDNDLKKNTYKPIDASIALNVTPANNLTLKPSFSFRCIMNELMFRNGYVMDETGNYKMTRFFDYNQLNSLSEMTVGIYANYILLDRYQFTVDYRWNYYNFSKNKDMIWNRPTNELHAGVDLRPIDDLNITLNYYMATGRMIPDYEKEEGTVKLNNIHDLNIGVSYLILKKATVFIEANNILGSIDKLKWQTWNGYNSMGFNMTLGAKYSF